jgi:hypothetical protein
MVLAEKSSAHNAHRSDVELATTACLYFRMTFVVMGFAMLIYRRLKRMISIGGGGGVPSL